MQETLWFDSSTWLVWLAPFAGILAGGFSKRKDSVVEGDRVYRHDVPARITHWTHGIGTMMLLISGIAMGLFFTPSLVAGGEQTWNLMNVHFAFVVLFLFGTFYYGTNTLLAPMRFKEHLPTRNAVDYTVRHYGLLLGAKKFTFPPEKKYFESEKVAYIAALGGSLVIIITGLFKVAAHSFDIPVGVMALMTPLHDIATVLMLLFFVAHVFFAAIAPFSWPVLGSMFNGYVSLEHAKHEHKGWLEQIGYTVADSDAPAKTSQPS